MTLDQETIVKQAYEHYIKTFARENGESEEVFNERMMHHAKEYARGRMDADVSTKEETTLIGYVGVDTGQIAIGDPCYIDKVLEAGDAITMAEGWNERIRKDERYLAVEDHSTVVENAIYGAIVNTGIGDGFYPVLVTTVDVEGWGKRISRIEIVFLDED